MKLVNCGCGNKNHADWINIDFVSNDKNIITHNLLEGLPLEDNSVDWVYSSNFLEHLTFKQAEKHIKECYRVLKSGGGIRIVVPDLENVCKEYLRVLNNARNNTENGDKEYDFILIELLDQMTRDYPSGLMGEYYKNANCNKDYVLKRHGKVFGCEKNVSGKSTNGIIQSKKHKEDSFISKTKNRIKLKIYRTLFGDPQAKDYGEFALSGEKHKWMYDEYGLGKLLENNNFKSVTPLSYNASKIPNFEKYALEVDDDGNEYKPNCLYIEAIK